VSDLVVDPGKIRQFGDPAGVTFCLVTNPEWLDRVEVVRTAAYEDFRVVPFDGGDEEFRRLMAEEIPEIAHVLVMSPERFFESPDQDVIGERRKLLAMACNSTPTDLPVLRHFLRCIEATDPDAQEAFSERFFELAERGEVLEYRDARYGTVAVLRLFDQDLVWNQQAGLLDWGEQQIVPSGEISVLPIEITDFDERLSLPLDGEIIIRGYPILHSGTPSFTRTDQQRIHDRLWRLADQPVRARVEQGVITDLSPVEKDGADVADMLTALFEVDSRYRTVWEIGHALNTTHDILPGNHAMNEVYGGTEGCLHWGLGLTPFTQYHLDIIAPGTVVLNEQGDALLGVAGQSAPERLARVPAGTAS
jgi:hypothetical protein